MINLDAGIEFSTIPSDDQMSVKLIGRITIASATNISLQDLVSARSLMKDSIYEQAKAKIKEAIRVEIYGTDDEKKSLSSASILS